MREKEKQALEATVPTGDGVRLSGEVRGINEKTHQTFTNSASNGDGHNPGEQQEAETLEINSLQGTVAETAADGGTDGDGEGVLGEDEDGEGGAYLYGGATARRVVGNLVPYDY
ncbi:hypothetical protein N7540_010555 [Penicillium herquei]|nr:hypothetical protein N7540_010555 [Penicillium herquei]